MKKTVLFLVSSILLILLISLNSALNNSIECRKGCYSSKMNTISEVNDNFESCKMECNSGSKRICILKCIDKKRISLSWVNKNFSECVKKCMKPYGDKFKTTKDFCTANNGLYQKLCNGPYFDIFCSQNYYCLCSGFGNYTCEEGFSYTKTNLNSLMTRKDTVYGWKDPHGKFLGDIGVCEKN